MSEYEETIALAASKKTNGNAGRLTKCNLKLTVDNAEEDGDVYIATKTEKLFLAVPVDQRIFMGIDGSDVV